MAATSINLHGKETVPFTRETVTTPSSSGWRSVSIELRENSGSSSKNSTPLCAREISPGRGIDPPPESPGPEMVWCGERNGRVSMSAVLLGRSPATE